MSSDNTTRQASLFEERELDPVTLQVLAGEFETIAEEIGNKMIRSSYSSIIRESEDIGAGIFTPEGREICESDFTPLHVGSLPGYIRGLLRAMEERGRDPDEYVNEGDVFLHNHPYYGASHSSDIAVCVPIFYGDELIGWSANTAHVLDIGAATPGIPIDLHDVYAEGQLFKARKVVSEGERVDVIWEHFSDNNRTPRLNEGDIQAMISAAEIGKDRYLGLIDKWGKDTVQTAGEDLMNYAEDLLRSEIADLPDGEWHEVGYMDDDGRNRDERIKIDVKVRINGDEIEIDLRDCDPQTPTAFNCPLDGSTKVGCYFIIRQLLTDTYTHDEYIPQNSGTFEPISVTTKKGTVVDPEPPAACYARGNQIAMMSDLIVKALRNVIPENIMAGNCAHAIFTSYSGPNPDEDEDDYWVYLEVNEGSYGGRPQEDGIDACDSPYANTRNRPTEDIELSHPLRVDRYELREDGHGAGRQRGGHGICRETTMLVDTTMTTEGDGENHTPWGVFGGEDGAGCSFWHLHTDDISDEITSDRREPPADLEYGDHVTDVERLPTMFDGVEFSKGDRFVVRTSMSGGYGDPFERPVETVYGDYLDGFIGASTAREEYGVVIEDGELDETATTQLRQEETD